VLLLYGIAAGFVVIAAWFCTLFAGRVPEGMHEFLVGFVRYSTHVFAYASLLADPFPSFGGEERYEVDIEIDGPLRQNRLTVLLRLIFVYPCLVAITYAFDPVWVLATIFNWFFAIVMGRVAAAPQRWALWTLRFRMRTTAYYMLVNPRYPAFGEKSATPPAEPGEPAALPAAT
jgi:hypothetical protein